MQKILLIIAILLQTTFLSLAQDKNAKHMIVLKNFMEDITSEKVTTKAILDKHVLVNSTDKEMQEYLLASLEELRLNVKSKKQNEIQYLRFADIPKKDVQDIDAEGKDTSSMYFLKYRNRQIVALYLDQNKIASFTLVSKGNNMAHFVTY